MKYELYSIGGDHIKSFESDWMFQDKEHIFIQAPHKRSFVITHVTHDIDADNKHIVRLYCQEKKVF